MGEREERERVFFSSTSFAALVTTIRATSGPNYGFLPRDGSCLPSPLEKLPLLFSAFFVVLSFFYRLKPLKCWHNSALFLDPGLTFLSFQLSDPGILHYLTHYLPTYSLTHLLTHSVLVPHIRALY